MFGLRIYGRCIPHKRVVIFLKLIIACPTHPPTRPPRPLPRERLARSGVPAFSDASRAGANRRAERSGGEPFGSGRHGPEARLASPPALRHAKCYGGRRKWVALDPAPFATKADNGWTSTTSFGSNGFRLQCIALAHAPFSTNG